MASFLVMWKTKKQPNKEKTHMGPGTDNVNMVSWLCLGFLVVMRGLWFTNGFSISNFQMLTSKDNKHYKYNNDNDNHLEWIELWRECMVRIAQPWKSPEVPTCTTCYLHGSTKGSGHFQFTQQEIIMWWCSQACSLIKQVARWQS